MKKLLETKNEAESNMNQDRADSQLTLNQHQEGSKRTNNLKATKIKMVSLTFMMLNTTTITMLKTVIISMTKNQSIAMMKTTTDTPYLNIIITLSDSPQETIIEIRLKSRKSKRHLNSLLRLVLRKQFN